MLLNWLAVEPSLYPECEYHLRGNTREPEGFIITDESNKVRNYVKDEIVVHEKDINFFTKKSDYLLNDKNHFSFTVIFTFIVI